MSPLIVAHSTFSQQVNCPVTLSLKPYNPLDKPRQSPASCSISQVLSHIRSCSFLPRLIYTSRALKSVFILGCSPGGAATVCVKQLMCKINPNMYVTVFPQDYLQQWVWEKFGMAIMLDHNFKILFIVTLLQQWENCLSTEAVALCVLKTGRNGE